MSKRFIDTEIWSKRWYRLLEPKHKLFWNYIFTKCNHAGIWDVDLELAEFYIGEKINKDKILEIFGDKIHIFNNSDKWFISSFIQFQYGELNANNNIHKSVINILKTQGIYEHFANPLQRVREGEKIKIKDKDQDKDQDQEGNHKKIKEKAKKPESKKQKQKHKHGEYKNVLLTDSEYEKLKIKLDSKLDDVIAFFSECKEMKGYKYKSDYLALKKWGIDAYFKKYPEEIETPQNSEKDYPYVHDCPVCGNIAALWVDKYKVKCPKCGNIKSENIKNEKSL